MDTRPLDVINNMDRMRFSGKAILKFEVWYLKSAET